MGRAPAGLRARLLALPAGEWARTDLAFQRAVCRAILCQEPNAADCASAARYFGPPRFPGTTSIGERKSRPELFQDTTASPLESFDDWVSRSIGKILRRMQAVDPLTGVPPPSLGDPAEIEHKIRLLLDFQTENGVPLCEAIPQQTYEDIFIRMVLLVQAGPPAGSPVDFYRAFNAVGRRIALCLIERLGDAPVEVDRLIQMAVLSGYVGINLKSSASAASTLLNRSFVPIQEAWARSPETAQAVPEGEISAVVDHLLAVCDLPAGQFGLESLADYRREVVEAREPTLLVFFCDDYIESLIDLKRFDLLLRANPALTVLYIPRNGRYGNDIAYEDMASILREPVFYGLRRAMAEGRLWISPDGPRSGCVDPRCISHKLIESIDARGQGKKVIFETKGCRNFEMLRGELCIPWYAGFNCNRALSIRTVGLDGPPVFLRIPPGLRAYQGFTRPVDGPSPSYPAAQVRFARMTTRQLFQALESPAYRALLDPCGDEFGLNRRLSDQSERLGLPVNEILERGPAGRLTD